MQEGISIDVAKIIDVAGLKKDVTEAIIKKAQATSTAAIASFFNVNHVRDWSQPAFQMAEIKGQGLRMIEELILTAWVEPKTEQRIQKYFDDNLDRVLGECLEQEMEKLVRRKVAKLLYKTKSERIQFELELRKEEQAQAEAKKDNE